MKHKPHPIIWIVVIISILSIVYVANNLVGFASTDPFTDKTLENQTAGPIDVITGEVRFNVSANAIGDLKLIDLTFEVFPVANEFYVHNTVYYSQRGILHNMTLEGTPGEWGDSWLHNGASKTLSGLSHYWFNETEFAFVYMCTKYSRQDMESVISSNRNRQLVDTYFRDGENWLCGFTGFTDEIDHENWRFQYFDVPDAYIDINEIPFDDGTVDENGWPSNIMAPVNCTVQGPNTTMNVEDGYNASFLSYYWPKYIFGSAPEVGPVIPGENGLLAARMLRETGPMSWTWTIMGRQETFIMPFYSGNAFNWIAVYGSGAGYMGHLIVKVSQCPGDFDNVIEPVGSWKGLRMWSPTPGERYFMNVEWADTGNCAEEPADGVCFDQTHMGGVFNVDVTGGERHALPPYNGECIPDEALIPGTPVTFPVNYNHYMCSRRNVTLWEQTEEEHRHCGYLGDDPSFDFNRLNWFCYDGLDEHGEFGPLLAHYVWECNDGLYTIEQGADIPATMNMLCDYVSTDDREVYFKDCDGEIVVSEIDPFTGGHVCPGDIDDFDSVING